MAAKKRKSKRQTLQQKYKIIKRTKEHHRKLKKGVIVSSGSKKKIRDSIPNAWPYKEDLLKEIQAAKEKMEDNKLRQKEKRKEEVVRNDCTKSLHFALLITCVLCIPRLSADLPRS